MHANLEIHHHNNIIVGQSTLRPRTHVIKTTPELPFLRWRGRGKYIILASDGRHGNGDWVPANDLRRWVWGGRISRLFVGRRMDCVANSVVAARTNKRYYSSRRWPQRSCINTFINSRVSEKTLIFLT